MPSFSCRRSRAHARARIFPAARLSASGTTSGSCEMHPIGHTRLQRYARGKSGTIHRNHGIYVFPDSIVAGLGEKPQHVYSVRFEAQELWGPQASARHAVYLDLWDNYLEQV